MYKIDRMDLQSKWTAKYRPHVPESDGDKGPRSSQELRPGGIRDDESAGDRFALVVQHNARKRAFREVSVALLRRHHRMELHREERQQGQLHFGKSAILRYGFLCVIVV